MQGRHPLAVINLQCPPNEVDVNVHPTKREVRLRHSWRVLERLERAIAFTLETVPTEPDATGGIPGLQGLSSSQTPKPVETHLNKLKTERRPQPTLTAAAGLETVSEVSRDVNAPAPPAWAVAAGRQLNLVGDQAEEAPLHHPLAPYRPLPWANPSYLNSVTNPCRWHCLRPNAACIGIRAPRKRSCQAWRNRLVAH